MERKQKKCRKKNMKKGRGKNQTDERIVAIQIPSNESEKSFKTKNIMNDKGIDTIKNNKNNIYGFLQFRDSWIFRYTSVKSKNRYK